MSKLLVFIIILFCSISHANEYGAPQVNPPKEDSVIKMIEWGEFFDGGYRIDIFCTDKTHYVYVSPYYSYLTDGTIEKINQSVGKNFKDFCDDIWIFDFDASMQKKINAVKLQMPAIAPIGLKIFLGI